MNTRKVLLLQTGQAPASLVPTHGDVPQWFARALAPVTDRVEVVPVLHDADVPAPDPSRYALAIMTGSSAMVTDRAPWSERLAGWVRQAVDARLPLLGVCYGHQLMAHALGGRVDNHPDGTEVGSLEVSLHDGAGQDWALQALPQQFHVQLTHQQTVLALPDGAQSLARSAHDPNQIVRYGEHAMSVQFHPEFTPEILRGYIDARSTALSGMGHDVDGLRAGLRETPQARGFLQDYVRRYLAA